VSIAALNVLGAVGHTFAHEDADRLSRDGVDRSVDPESPPGREVDGEDAKIAAHREPTEHRVAGRYVHQRPGDVHMLAVHASDEARLSAPHRGPHVCVISSRRRCEQSLLRQKRKGSRDDASRDRGAVSARGLALADTLLDGDLAVVKSFVGQNVTMV